MNRISQPHNGPSTIDAHNAWIMPRIGRRPALGIMAGSLAALTRLLKGNVEHAHKGAHHDRGTHDHTAEILEQWKKEAHVHAAIKEAGSFGRYFNKTLKVEQRRAHFFATKEDAPEEISCGCIDERNKKVQNPEGKETHFLHLAGTGIFPAIDGFSTETYDPMNDEYIEAVARILARQGTTVVTSHVECGAAAAAYAKHYKLTPAQMENVPQENIDQFAKAWSSKLAEKLHQQYIIMGRPDLAAKVCYQEVKNIAPSGVHTAKYAILDATNEYDPGEKEARETDVPTSFINSQIASVQAAIAGIDVSKKISFGKHGPGKLFTSDNPWTAVGMRMGKPGDKEEKEMWQRLNAWRNGLTMEDWRRVRVEAVTAELDA